MRILLQLQLWCLIFLLFLVFSSSSSDIFGSFWNFFWWESSFFPIQSKKTEKIQKFKAVGGPLWLDESGGKGFKPSNHWETEQVWIFFNFIFLKKNLMRNKALLDHPESSLHNRRSKVVFFFLSKLTLKKGKISSRSTFCVNQIRSQGVLFYFIFDLLIW